MKVVVMKYFVETQEDAETLLETLGNGDGTNVETIDIAGDIRYPTKKEKENIAENK